MAAGDLAVSARKLGALQVAALLVSASYGIGFLFGSGEYALRYGMAGAIYGVATAVGMIAMATFAGRLWVAGRAVWDLLGDRSGDRVRRLVALLSIVWMAGVLAAQIHGAVAVARLLGADLVTSYIIAVVLIFAASRFELRAASFVFAGCLAASALVLLYALTITGGVAHYTASWPAFAAALPTLGVAQAITIGVGVGLLVCTGADYHQFVLAARGPGAAVRGCLLAGLGLFVLAFLPPAVVLAAVAQPTWPGVVDGKQVVPQVLSLAASGLAPVAGPLMLGILGAAALGSGAAVLRAMVSALEAALPRGVPVSPNLLAGGAMGLAVTLTASGLPIVDTMVSVNVVYIASVGVGLLGLLREKDGPKVDETWSIAAGFSGSVAVYMVAWLGQTIPNAELVALVVGLASAAGVRVALHRCHGDLGHRAAHR
jgi:solute:Na+ symporter, SSS family